MTTVEKGGAWRDMWASGLLSRFVLLCAGIWLHAADSLVTATLVPAIVDEIGGIAYAGWMVSLYQIGAIVAGAATAMLSQRIGVKHVLAAAALAYGSGCVLAAIAPGMPVLLAARLVQGIGGGMMVSLSYVAIQQFFPEHLWSRLFGITAAIWAAGSLLGPLIGGVFASLDAWRWAFWFFAVQAGLLGTLAMALLPAGSGATKTAGKWPLFPLLLLTAATLLIAQAGVVERVATAIAACLIGTALLYAAARLDQRSSSRMLPLQALNPRHPVGAGLLMLFMLCMAATGFWVYGPLLLNIMFGTDPLISGYILAGEALAWSAATMAVSSAPLSAGKVLIRTGAALIAFAAAGFAVAVPVGSFAAIVVCALLQGVGFGLCWPSIVRRIVRFSGESDRSLAAAAPGTVQRTGYAVGAAAAGLAANMSGLADGMSVEAAQTAGFWIFAGFMPVLVVGMFCAWRFTAESDASQFSR